MKKSLSTIKLFSLIILTLFLSSCDDISQKITVNIPVNPPAIELDLINNDLETPILQSIQKQTQEEKIVLVQKRFDLGLFETLKSQNQDIKNLKELTFDSANIEVISPKDYDLSTLNGIEIYFEEDLVAKVVDIDNNNRSLTLKTHQKDVKKYSKNKTILLTVKGAEKPTVAEVKAKLHLKFTAKLGLK